MTQSANKNTMHKAVFLFALFCLLPNQSYSSYAIYIGKNLTTDGSVLIGGSGDEVSSHWLEIVPAQEHGADATMLVGVTKDAFMPGKLSNIPQAKRTYRFLTMNYSEYEGFPPPLSNGGLNEYNVAARDVWSPSREELVAMTPAPQTGPQYSDLSRIAMQRARTAREAAEVVGGLIDAYGYSTYGGNSHMFADKDEGWVLINYAGGKGLWIAQRLGPDEVRMSYPGYVFEVPADFQKNPEFMGSKNFISFAVEQGWYTPDSGEAFNAAQVYGDNPPRFPRDEMEKELRQAAPIDLKRMMAAVRDVRISKDSTGYGQVARLKKSKNPELNLLWIAPTGSVTAPFIPYRIGVQSIAPQFGKHRYLTKGEATRFLKHDWQIQEATEFAGRTFKRLMYFTCDRPKEFLPEVTATLQAFEHRLIEEQSVVTETASALYAAKKPDLARRYLTDYSAERGRQALQIGNALLNSIETRTREQYGYRLPSTEPMSELSYDRIDCQQ